jgi:predicted TIM-barrel fold metal-dependent hydrolase
MEGAMMLDDLEIIDCDAHFTEPADLWSARAPRSMRDRMPVQRSVDGRTGWYLDGELWASTGANVITHGGRKVRGLSAQVPYEDVDPASWDVKARLELLDTMGVKAQILYPNGVGFSANHIFAIEDLPLRTEVQRIYNDFLADIQEESGGRLLPQALLPLWDMTLTVSEMERLRSRGITGFTFTDRPELLGLPELPEPYFDPMWEFLNDSGAVGNFHVGAGRRSDLEGDLGAARGFAPKSATQPDSSEPPTVANPYWRTFGLQRRSVITGAQMGMSNLRIIANLCMSDLFDRYPGVKLVSVESGIGWIPFLFETLEYLIDELVTDPGEQTLQKRRPTEYFHDHIYGTFWYETLGPSRMLDAIGVNNVLVETDIPHGGCLYPGAREHFDAVLADLDPLVRRRVLHDNAVELYGLNF